MVDAGEISLTERDMVKDVYEQTYDLNAAKSLLAYEMRGIRLHRVGGWIGDAGCVGACGTRSTEIATDVSISLAHASVAVIRYRAAQAVTSRLAGVLYAAFVAAMVSFALSTSWLISRQSGDIATVKSCAYAEAALLSAGTTTFSRSVTLRQLQCRPPRRRSMSHLTTSRHSQRYADGEPRRSDATSRGCRSMKYRPEPKRSRAALVGWDASEMDADVKGRLIFG